MLMSWTYNERTAKPTATVVMRGVCLRTGLSLSLINIFGGELGQRPQSIDSRHIRH